MVYCISNMPITGCSTASIITSIFSDAQESLTEKL